MSDVSALSHEYQTSAKLAEELNEAIIAIKKARVHHRSGLNQEQRRRLADTLGAVRSRLANNERAPGEVVPQEVVERLVGRHGSKMAYFLEDLSAAAEVLSGATTPIDEKVVHLLDEICDVADQTASSMFRRLRRR
jgi:hypothetical protein